MTTTTASPATDLNRKRTGLLTAIVRTREGAIGALLFGVVLGVVLLGPWIAPHDPETVGLGPAFSGPSGDFLLGTDGLGRDVYSRLLSGGHAMILLPLAGTLLAFVTGGVLGMVAAYVGGLFELIVLRTFDILMSFPQLLLMLILVAGLGSSPTTIIVTLALVYAPRAGLAVGAVTRTVVKNDYVIAAQARGERLSWILGREILPNITGPVMAEFALRLTYAIIFVSVLSYLGLGTQPPAPDWGLMISESQNALTLNPWAVLAPALCLAVLAVAVNLIADAITRVVTVGR